MKNALLKAKTGSVRAAAELAKTRILDMDSADYSQLLKKLYPVTIDIFIFPACYTSNMLQIFIAVS